MIMLILYSKYSVYYIYRYICNSKTLCTFFGVFGVELYMLSPLTTCSAKLFLYDAVTGFICIVVVYHISHAILLAFFPAFLGIGNLAEVSFSLFARTRVSRFCVFSAKICKNMILISF